MSQPNTTGENGTESTTPEGSQQPDGGQSTQESRQSEQQDGQQSGQQQAEDKDYRALYEQTLAQSRKWESRAKDNADKAKKWDQAEEANKSEAEKHASRAEQAEARAHQAMTAAVNAEIKAAAHGWATPGDAPRYLDDKNRYVTDDGEIDSDAIATDVAAVLKDRPHLAAAEQRRGPHPDPGQGARGGLSIADRIRDAETKGDTQQALRLKTEQLLDGGS